MKRELALVLSLSLSLSLASPALADFPEAVTEHILSLIHISEPTRPY